MAMFVFPLMVMVGTLLRFSSGKSICCEHVGCFTNVEPFDHMYLPECPEKMGMAFHLHNKDGHTDSVSRTVVPLHFDPTARTVFIVHGWRNSGTTRWVMEMKDALLAKGNVNVVVVDWEKGAGHLMYYYSAANIRTVGAEIADVMDVLVEKGTTTYDNLWCVGFSLGAHACGQAGMRTERPIGRVTGLDPAGPHFDGYDIMIGLNPGVAKYVDAIHTDGYGLAAYYGTLRPLAKADFYPNEGWYQPGCWTYYSKDTVRKMKGTTKQRARNEETPVPQGISCSHSRAPQLFIESVRNQGCFVARQICEDEGKLPGSCTPCPQNGVCTNMGYNADETKHGKFYLKTTSSSPFCKW